MTKTKAKTKTRRRDPDKSLPVHIHPQLHRALAISAREDGYSIQGRMHLILCETFGRPDLVATDRRSAVAVAS